MESASNAVADLAKWIDNKVIEQDGKEAFEEPAFTAAQMLSEVALATRKVRRTDKTPKPTPTPSPAAEEEGDEK